MMNSARWDGKTTEEAKKEMAAFAAERRFGESATTYRLRDWGISRQRFWGAPIPIVYCDACGMVPVPDEQLPVELPLDAAFTPTGQSPLVSHQGFLHATCPTCGGEARRETDTMDTFVDSSWYWFRYTSPGEDRRPFDPERAKKWSPVDLYCGGIEHAILHLLYARFFTKVLRDLGLTEYSEPFLRLRNQGMILSEEGVKMSKSRGTQVDPDFLVERHGADALRLHLMYLGPWDQGGPWNSTGISGMERFIRRAYQVVAEAADHSAVADAPAADQDAIRRLTHRTVERVTRDLDDFAFNTMVAALIEFVNELMKRKDEPVARSAAWREAVETLTLLMAPSTPHVAEELWDRLGKPYSVHQQAWPTFDPALTRAATVELVIQVNGKVRDRVPAAVDLPESEARSLALGSDKVMATLGGRDPAKVIYVPGRLINVVVK